MKSAQQDRAVFVSFCIEQYAKAKNITTEEWVNFVMKNSTERGFANDYDIVCPVADDSVYTQFTLYEGGIISRLSFKS